MAGLSYRTGLGGFNPVAGPDRIMNPLKPGRAGPDWLFEPDPVNPEKSGFFLLYFSIFLYKIVGKKIFTGLTGSGRIRAGSGKNFWNRTGPDRIEKKKIATGPDRIGYPQIRYRTGLGPEPDPVWQSWSSRISKEDVFMESKEMEPINYMSKLKNS